MGGGVVGSIPTLVGQSPGIPGYPISLYSMGIFDCQHKEYHVDEALVMPD